MVPKRLAEEAVQPPRLRLRWAGGSTKRWGVVAGGEATLTVSRKDPWPVVEAALIDAGFVPYWAAEEEQRVAALVCCSCRRGLAYVGMTRGRARFGFSICPCCLSWMWFRGPSSNEGG